MINLKIKNKINIPEKELEIKASRSSGPGGQHVNKTETKITIKWNILNSSILNTKQKKMIKKKLGNKLTKEGEIVIQNSQTRSQQQNKENAINNLTLLIRKALYIPQKRKKTKVPKKEKERRLYEKKHRSEVKKFRNKIFV